MVDVGLLVAAQCDAHVRKVLGPAYKASMVEHIQKSRVAKGRLLHYFPIKHDQGERLRDSWCAWHNDHGRYKAACNLVFFVVVYFVLGSSATCDCASCLRILSA